MMRASLFLAGLLLCAPVAARAQNALPQYALGGTIGTANAYQVLQFPADGIGGVRNAYCPHGGTLENTSNTDQTNAYVIRLDFTGIATAGQTTPGPGATTIDPAATSGRTGGKQIIPPTTAPIYVFGPAGATFKGFCS